MSRDRWPKPGRGRPVMPDFHGTALRDRSAELAPRARHSVPQVRQITVGAKTYYAISADELLDFDSLGNYGRPGHQY
jgi:hypothetical protein